MDQETQNRMYEILEELSGHDVIEAVTTCHGFDDILNEDMARYLVDEGFCTAWDIGYDNTEGEDC